jgi:hypothetical protein
LQDAEATFGVFRKEEYWREISAVSKLFSIYVVGPAIIGFAAGRGPAESKVPIDSNPYWLHKGKSCGPLCLAFLEKYFGGTRTYRDIAELCRPGSQGVSLLDIKRAAGSLGYHTAGFETTTEQLKRFRLPAILQLSLQGGKQGHFIVLLGWNDRERVFQTFDPWRPALVLAPEADLRAHFVGKGLLVSDRPLPSLATTLETPPLLAEWPLLGLVCLDIFLVGSLGWRLGHRPSGSVASPQQLLTALLATSLLILPSCSVNERNEATAQPENPYEYKAGIVQQGTVIQHTFRILNPTNRVVRIEDLKSN